MPRRERPWVIEPTWYLRVISLNEYRQTGWWRNRRMRFLEQRREQGRERVCDLCGPWEPHDEIPKWHVHHLSYRNLGAERDSDLSYLCSPCHYLVHYPDHQQAREWCELRGINSDLAAVFEPDFDQEVPF